MPEHNHDDLNSWLDAFRTQMIASDHLNRRPTKGEERAFLFGLHAAFLLSKMAASGDLDIVTASAMANAISIQTDCEIERRSRAHRSDN